MTYTRHNNVGVNNFKRQLILGGIEGLEQQIREEEEAKKEEEDRRVRISSKTRSRLSQLLNRGQRPKWVNLSLLHILHKICTPYHFCREEPKEVPRSQVTTQRSKTRSEASLNSLFSRLANKRRLLPAPQPEDNVAQEYVLHSTNHHPFLQLN